MFVRLIDVCVHNSPAMLVFLSPIFFHGSSPTGATATYVSDDID